MERGVRHYKTNSLGKPCGSLAFQSRFNADAPIVGLETDMSVVPTVPSLRTVPALTAKHRRASGERKLGGIRRVE
jgi:hypothetical protein